MARHDDSMQQHLPTARIASLFYPRTMVASYRTLARDFAPEERAAVYTSLDRYGARDMIGALLHPAPNVVALMWAASDEEQRLNAHERSVVGQIGLHVESSLRLRQRPETLLGELTATGRLIDRTNDAPTGESLEAHGLRIAHARKKAQRTEVESLGLWTALVDGAVTLAPRPGPGRTHYDVLENAPDAYPFHALTPREVAVLEHSARGLSTKLVGYALGITPADVSSRLGSAAAKLGTASRTELVRVAALLCNDRRAHQSDEALTAAEREILDHLRDGLTNAQIASRRARSTRTIANQVAALLRKTGAASRRALVANIPA